MSFFSFLKNQHFEEQCPSCHRDVYLLVKGKCFEEEQPDYFNKNLSILGIYKCNYCKQDISVLYHKVLEKIRISAYAYDELESEIQGELEKIEDSIDEVEGFISDSPNENKYEKQLKALTKKYEKEENRLYKKLDKIEAVHERYSDRLLNRTKPPEVQDVTISGM